ncbi:PGM3, partial [Symbiodinium microadriaticum]
AATGQAAEAAAMAKSSYSRSSDATPIGYGTAGFRTLADVLDNVLYRTGLLAALRSKALGKRVGVMVTASHNPEKDNGVKLVEPLGEMLPPEWEAHATRLANSADADLSALLVELSESLGVDLSAPGDIVVGRDTRSSSARLAMALCDGAGVLRPTRVRSAGVVTTPQLHYLVRCENDPTYGLPSIPGYEEKLICAFRKLLGSAERTPRVYTPVVNVDCACGVGAIALGAMLDRLGKVGLTTNMVNLVGEGTLNEGCGADFVKTKQKPPAKADLSAGRWVSFDGDADRIVYFFSQDGFCLLDGDRIALLLASFLKSLLTRAGAEDIKLGLVQTAYANGASTARAKTDVGEAQIACAKTGVK